METAMSSMPACGQPIPFISDLTSQLTVDVCSACQAYAKTTAVQSKLDQLMSYVPQGDYWVRDQIRCALELAYMDGMHDMRRVPK